MAACLSAKVVPVFDQQSSSGTRSIWNYITDKQWPILVTLMVNDDAEKLQKFAESGIDWQGFLLSSDTEGRRRHCPPEFTSYSSETQVSRDLMRHPYPSNPFHIAIMHDARLCCQMIRETATSLDLSTIEEAGFTAYHVVFSGLDIIRSESHTEESFNARCDDYMKHFVRDFFTSDQVIRMSERRNYYHMRPIEWGVYCGYVDLVDQLLYRSHSALFQCDVSGLMEHAQMDFSSVVATDPSRFVSILSIMSEVLGDSSDTTMEIFRKPLVLAPLIDALYARHRPVMTLLCLLCLTNTVLLLASCNSDYRTYVTGACTSLELQQPPRFFLASRGVSLIVLSAMITATLLGRLRKNGYRSSMGFPSQPRKSDRDCLVWMLPNCTALVMDCLLLVVLCAPSSVCHLLGDSNYRPLAGTLVLVDMIAQMCGLTTSSRLLPLVSKFINSFYRSFAMFAQFIIIYMLMLFTFSRLLQVAYRSESAGNSTIEYRQLGPEDEDFLASAYRTFLITLNVFDTAMFQPSADKADLMFTHIAFILIAPVMFINFVVGVLSSVVGTTMDCDVECRYLLKLGFSEFCEASLHWVFRLQELVSGRKRRLVLCICRPLNRSSRSIGELKDCEL